MGRRTSSKSARIAGKICLICLVAAAINSAGSTALALDPMGPPLARVQYGQYSAGAEFALGQTDVELTGGKWFEANPAPGDPTTGVATDVTLTDFETAKLYGTVGYGFAENWEAFLRIGAAKAEFGDSIWVNGEDFDSGIDFAIGGGIRATFFEIPALDLRIGGVAQANWSSLDGKLDSSQWTGPDFVEIELAEAQVAIGGTYTWNDQVSVYGGPFVHYIRGDLKDEFVNSDYSWDIDHGPVFGGYLGALVELAEDCVFYVEYQQSSDASVIGTGLTFRR